MQKLIWGGLWRKSGPAPVRSAAAAIGNESALRALGLVDRNDQVTEVVAQKIIEIAQTGERNVLRLAALTIEQLGIPVTIAPAAE